MTIVLRDQRRVLEDKLRIIDAEIARHPLASDPVKQAHLIIQARGIENKDRVASELAGRNLPSFEQLGKIHLEQMGTWWRLHRNRRRVLTKLEQLDA